MYVWPYDIPHRHLLRRPKERVKETPYIQYAGKAVFMMEKRWPFRTTLYHSAETAHTRRSPQRYNAPHRQAAGPTRHTRQRSPRKGEDHPGQNSGHKAGHSLQLAKHTGSVHRQIDRKMARMAYMAGTVLTTGHTVHCDIRMPVDRHGQHHRCINDQQQPGRAYVSVVGLVHFGCKVKTKVRKKARNMANKCKKYGEKLANRQIYSNFAAAKHGIAP